MSMEKVLKHRISEAVEAVRDAEKAALDTTYSEKLDIVRRLMVVEQQIVEINEGIQLPMFKVTAITDLRELYEEGLIDIRALNVCKRSGCSTVGELCNYTDEEIMRFRNMGRKSFEMLKKVLSDAGLETRKQGMNREDQEC